MNMKRLAELCGVSVSTVSKAFSSSNEISTETRDMIVKTAKENGCYDKYNKNRFDKKVIAVICPEARSEYYTSFITYLNEEISRRGGIMTVSVTDFIPNSEVELFSYYSSYCKADGIIYIAPSARIVNKMNMPAVSIFPYGEAIKSVGIENIYSEKYQAMLSAIKYLKTSGHTKIGFAGEVHTPGKLSNFKKAMRECLLPIYEKYIKTSERRFEQAGKDIASEWISKNDLPTAIIAAYDYLAIGIINTLKYHEISVPEDISVIGSDNISVTPFLETSLSSINDNADKACRLATEIIFKKLENPFYCEKEPIIISSEFVLRKSAEAKKHKVNLP